VHFGRGPRVLKPPFRPMVCGKCHAGS
jgi:hypothetical protein